MKIRNGFVSNSSSSSFLIKISDKFPDTLSVAENMILNKFCYYQKYNDKVQERERIVLKNIAQLRKEGIVNYSFFFPSTNEDTYIDLITENYIFVSTCNNIIWNISNIAERNIPDEVRDKYPDSSLDYGELYIDDIKNIEYYHLESGVFATKIDKFKMCKKCYDELWSINGKELCLRCNGDIIARGLKLGKIKKIMKI
jgi:hypothetical protein